MLKPSKISPYFLTQMHIKSEIYFYCIFFPLLRYLESNLYGFGIFKVQYISQIRQLTNRILLLVGDLIKLILLIRIYQSSSEN
jgi:hypothetical protein